VVLVMLLSVLWLHMPDASAIDVTGSVLLGLAVIWVAGAGETTLFLRLCDTPRTRGRLLRGALLMMLGVALWIGACSVVSHLQSSDPLRAGYLNSRVSFRWRNLFSFTHIMTWLGWTWTAIEWMVAGVIAGFFFPLMTGAQPIQAVRRTLRSITFWIVLVLGTTTASLLTGLLMQWTPGHGLRIEVVSVVLRLAVAMLIDGTLAVFLLAVLAVCVRRSDTTYHNTHDTPGGTPDVSQPRTADNP